MTSTLTPVGLQGRRTSSRYSSSFSRLARACVSTSRSVWEPSTTRTCSAGLRSILSTGWLTITYEVILCVASFLWSISTQSRPQNVSRESRSRQSNPCASELKGSEENDEEEDDNNHLYDGAEEAYHYVPSLPAFQRRDRSIRLFCPADASSRKAGRSGRAGHEPGRG